MLIMKWYVWVLLDKLMRMVMIDEAADLGRRHVVAYNMDARRIISQTCQILLPELSLAEQLLTP